MAIRRDESAYLVCDDGVSVPIWEAWWRCVVVPVRDSLDEPLTLQSMFHDEDALEFGLLVPRRSVRLQLGEVYRVVIRHGELGEVHMVVEYPTVKLMAWEKKLSGVQLEFRTCRAGVTAALLSTSGKAKEKAKRVSLKSLKKMMGGAGSDGGVRFTTEGGWIQRPSEN